MNEQMSIVKEAIKKAGGEIDLKEYIKIHKTSTKFLSSQKLKGRNQKDSKLGKTELNAMLFKLKKYFNELHTMSKAKERDLSSLREQFENLEKKAQHIKSFKDIELKNEKISVKETTMFKESKEAIQNQVEKLIENKKSIEIKYKNEIEYQNTLTHLIKSQKEKLQTLNDIMTTNSEKITTIKNFNINLEINNIENERKSKNLKIVFDNLHKEKTNLSQFMLYGKNQVNIITEQLALKEINLKELKREIDRENDALENSLKTDKEKVLKELKETEILKKNKHEKENEYLKLILGLDLIKKYFLDVDRQGKEINYSEIIESNEFKTFTSKKFYLKDEEKSKDSSEYLNKIFSRTDKDFYNKNFQENKSIIKPLRPETFKHNSIDHKSSEKVANSSNYTGFRASSYNRGSQEICIIYIKEINEKFQDLDIQYDDLISIYSKINYKTSFYHTNMINLNMKIINLESKKDNYKEEVQKIMSHNYQNFNDLVQNNSRFENFMVGMKKEILLSRNILMTQRFKKDMNKILSDDTKFIDYKSQYYKLHNFMSTMKSFLENINTFFKIIQKENGWLKDERNLKSFLKLGTKARADLRLIRNRLEEILQEFDKFFINGENAILPPVNLKPSNDYPNLNILNGAFLRASTIILKSPKHLLSDDFRLNAAGENEGTSVLVPYNLNNFEHRRSNFGALCNLKQNQKSSIIPPSPAFNKINFSKDEYIEDLFAYFERENCSLNEIKIKIEKLTNIGIDQVRNFMNSNITVKNNFLEMDIQYEKLLFYFFYNYENVLHLFKLIIDSEIFLKDIINTSDLNSKVKKIIEEDEIFDKILLPLTTQNKSIENEENLYVQDTEKESEDVSNSKIIKKEESTIASLRKMRQIKSVKPERVSSENKNLKARAHSGFCDDFNQHVIKKLYMPFIRERDYNKNLNQNISDVKKDTRNSSILNHYLNKKKKDIGNLAKELAIYDNPSKIIFILIRN
jgi:hypothetical protein